MTGFPTGVRQVRDGEPNVPSIPEEDWEDTWPDPSRDRLNLMCDGSCFHRHRNYQRHWMYIQNLAIAGRQSLRKVCCAKSAPHRGTSVENFDAREKLQYFRAYRLLRCTPPFVSLTWTGPGTEVGDTFY